MLKDLGFVTDGLSFASATSAVLFIVLISYTFNRWITGKGSSELLLEKSLIDRYGCKEPPKLKNRLPFGIDMIIKLYRALWARNVLQHYTDVIEKVGETHRETVLGKNAIMTVDPENIKAILSTQFDEFDLGDRKAVFQPLFGHGIFTQNGDEWKASRDALRPQFKDTHSLSFALIQEVAEEYLERLVPHVKHKEIDLQPYFFRLTFRTSLRLISGAYPLKVPEGDIQDAVCDAYTEAQDLLVSYGNLCKFKRLSVGKRFRRAKEKLDDYIYRLISDAIDNNSSVAHEDRYIFVKSLVDSTDNEATIRDTIMHTLLAGRDSTACLLSWTIRLLAEYKTVQRKLRAECVDLATFADGELPTQSEIKQMTYLNMVIREVLRLYPPVPINARTALETTTLPKGGGSDGQSPILVREGDIVVYLLYTMHRLKSIYGPDADEFRPSRWEDGSLSQSGDGTLAWAYLPFNGGPRVCLGQKFALTEASYIIVRLLQEFEDIELSPEFKDPPGKPSQGVGMFLTCGEGCKVILTARDKNRQGRKE